MKVLVYYEYKYKHMVTEETLFANDSVMLDVDRHNLIAKFSSFLLKKRVELIHEVGFIVKIRERIPKHYLISGRMLWFLPEFENDFFKGVN